jgi:hypothetical protein
MQRPGLSLLFEKKRKKKKVYAQDDFPFLSMERNHLKIPLWK